MFLKFFYKKTLKTTFLKHNFYTLHAKFFPHLFSLQIIFSLQILQQDFT